MERLILRNAVKRLSSDVWTAGRSIWSVDLDGREPDVEVEVDEVDAPPHVFGLLADGRVCRRRRRFSLDGRKLMPATSYIPVALAAEAGLDRVDIGPGGVYARLADTGHAPKHAREQL